MNSFTNYKRGKKKPFSIMKLYLDLNPFYFFINKLINKAVF